jgi:hypothetical protein
MDEIQYIKHSHIDFTKWDACIDRAPDGLLYARSYFLNEMSPGWDALVMGDYEAVMPLTHRHKWSVSYLYQPAFCAELGVFSTSILTKEQLHAFLAQIPSSFRYIDICLNRGNVFDHSAYPFRYRKNYILSLAESYATIAQKYALNHRRNIKKAQNAQLFFDDNIPVHESVAIAHETIKEVSNITVRDYQSFIRVFEYAYKRRQAVSAGVRDDKGILLSVAVFFFYKNTWYYLLAGSTQKGRQLGAAHFLIDQFIARYSSTASFIDFEGSDMPSLAFFYGGFGAKEIAYPALILNRLPLWIRWLKR